MKKILALLALLLLTSCSSGGPSTPQEQETLTIGLTYIPDVQFAPVYVAEANGYFADAGLDITIRHHGAQESLFGAIQAGEEDIVFAGGDEMMQARSTGVDIVNWATMYQTYPVALIVKADSDINSAADLEGKSVGLPGPYGENYFALLAMIDEYGLEDVDINYIGYTQTTALATDSVDAIIGFSNNDVVAMRHAGIDVVELPLVEGRLPLIGVGLGSMADHLDPETLAKVVEALEQGTRNATADPEAALDITRSYVPSLADPEQRELAAQVLDATLELYSGGQSFGHQDVQLWAQMSEFMEDAELLETPVAAEDAYTLAVLDYRTNNSL
ncbi:NitT/TauT family transport system substrate-binding protein [Trueperella bonasi]|uniref:NitT/TauT family transport system substrate-binding protein n=1 Tax=Trueperella bonasi TaxID=312286 RepID=A0ABT9NE30_9ACTO|nr:ABC transporter substrate-binding protein [Trueperella bonasi]MDP9805455.1 NitT/TauT family transport system substrate-binding protein [Trueperella bonasi]